MAYQHLCPYLAEPLNQSPRESYITSKSQYWDWLCMCQMGFTTELHLQPKELPSLLPADDSEPILSGPPPSAVMCHILMCECGHTVARVSRL